MKPAVQDILKLAPEIDRSLAEEHLHQLGEDYFRAFSPDDIGRHLRGLARLSAEQPVVVQHASHEALLELTVLGFDYPGAFSLIAGVLSSSGFSIQSGLVFTYRKRQPATGRRRIIDTFLGRVDTDLSREEWLTLLEERLLVVFRTLEQGGEDARHRARSRVNEWVADRLALLSEEDKAPVLYPVELTVSVEDQRATRLHVRAQDTPFFLYTLSNALALYGVSIERIRIRTVLGKVDDEIFVVDSRGRAITDPAELERLKLSVLLTKQFSYFLDRSPDPSVAMDRFEQMLAAIIRSPRAGRFLELISDPNAMGDLARLLGTSDFLWEDFIRMQYESLIPILKSHIPGTPLAIPPGKIRETLEAELAECRSYQEAREALNRFKDRQIFLIDLENILQHGGEFDRLAEHLTALAEAVVAAAAERTYRELLKRYGEPRSVAGLPSRYAVFGLGKFGGAALGYASDIELMLIYSDSGTTAGPDRITNAEFFSLLVQRLSRFIRAKRQGIFHVDLRLRPYGESGPLACSLDSFCRYYAPGGPAHSYEKLALVRLRAVAADHDLGRRVERLRDELIYLKPDINLEELRNLRALQFDEKNRPGRLNAKFSPGAPVDLEYAVQILQVTFGGRYPQLRTPRMKEALVQLKATGVIPPEEAAVLMDAYRFLRRLINALRMLRGSALDLFLPPMASDEYVHLARRMGYQPRRDLSAQLQLHLDFNTHTAAVRAFARKIMGRESLPSAEVYSVADLVLGDKLPRSIEEQVLRKAGLRDIQRAAYNLRALSRRAPAAVEFAPLAVLAFDLLQHEPDPDMALNNWERFVSRIPYAAEHFDALLSQPRRLEILLGIFSRSQFLADTLAADPEFFDWVTEPRILHRARTIRSRLSELRALSLENRETAAWRRALCLFRRRELLRIGTRDIYLQSPVEYIMRDLSALADSILKAELERLFGRNRTRHTPTGHLPCAVVALGKLGGNELNYSSDIDLLILQAAPLPDHEAERLRQQVKNLLADLGAVTEAGRIYRVDLRLRPYGRSGELTVSLPALASYLQHAAQLWELQALLKSRVVGGPSPLTEQSQAMVAAVLRGSVPPAPEIARQVRKMREGHGDPARRNGAVNVKLDPGGIRDIEFLVQAYQLALLRRHPALLGANTLDALELCDRLGILPPADCRRLAAHYRFLRRVEHYLQIMDDRRIHTLPAHAEYLERLARRLYGRDGDAVTLTEQLDACMSEVSSAFEKHLARLG
ncbi:MAG TPA: glutamate-ammonia-ligase adenylyltransferase [Kiritimatiellae bacterium]|nr:glutamate-ammonia-ligase adenylyltransferase [Kiritimatiellia bacterium]